MQVKGAGPGRVAESVPERLPGRAGRGRWGGWGGRALPKEWKSGIVLHGNPGRSGGLSRLPHRPPAFGKGIHRVKASLIMVQPDGKQREVPLVKPRMIVGRNTDCAIRIPVSSVSRHHCELAIDENRLSVKDLGSSNGTYVNRTRAIEQLLAAGDILTIGPAVFVVRIEGKPENVDAKIQYERGVVAIPPAQAGAGPARKPITDLDDSDLPIGDDDSSVVDFDFSEDDKDMPKL